MITLAMLRHSVRTALSFVKKEELPLEHLQGVYFHFIDCATLKLVGTNGQRIVVVRLSVPHGSMAKDKFFLSAAKCADLLTHFLEARDTTEVTVFYVAGQIMVCCGDAIFCADHTPVDYPDYEKIFSRNISTPYPGKSYCFDYVHEALTVVAPLTDGSVYMDMHTADYLRIRPGINKAWPGVIGIDIAIAALSRTTPAPKEVI